MEFSASPSTAGVNRALTLGLAVLVTSFIFSTVTLVFTSAAGDSVAVAAEGANQMVHAPAVSATEA